MQVIELPEPNFEPLSLRFAPDGLLLAAWSWGRVCVLDTARGTAVAMLGKTDVGLGSPGVGFTADGRAVVASQHHAKPPVHVYNLESGEVLRQCPELHGSAIEVGPGGRLVYLTVNWPGYWVEIVRWNPLTGERLPAFGKHKDSLNQLAVSANEKWVAGANGDTVRVWNLGGPKLPARATRQFTADEFTAEHNRHGIRGLAIASDGAFVAFNGPGVQIGNVRTGASWTVSPSGVRWGREVAFHPSRPILAYSGMSREVAFYDAVMRTELKRFAWNIGNVTATAFSEDGLRCAAAGMDKVVVWDVDL